MEIVKPKDWMLAEKEFYKLGFFMSFSKYLENGLFQNEKNFQIKKAPTFKERFVFTNMLESTNLSVCIHDLLIVEGI